VSSYFEQENEESPWVFKEETQFKIKIESNGEIWYKPERTKLDGKRSENKAFPTVPVFSGYLAQEQIAHTLKQAEMLKKQTIENRPLNADEPFKSPCTFCVFSDVCDSVDSREIKTTADFLEKGKEVVQQLKQNKE
jgi:hypothetical protein